MKFQFLHKFISRYPILSIILSKYVIILIVFVVWMLFFDNFSYLEHRVLNKKIEELEDNKAYYKNEITKDSLKIKHLNNSNMIEKYAREKYFMKKDSEDIFIIEYEEDREKDSLLEAQQ